MPLMLMNLRADGGLESHREYLRDEVETWLVDKQEEADVTFICSRVDSDNDDTVMLAAHQAVLAPVSSVLRDMFSEHSCSMVRNMIYITMDCDPQVLQSILCLIYNGKTYLSTTAVERMKAIVKMLDLKFPGGFDRSILARGSVPPTNNVFQVKNRPKESGVKRPHESCRSVSPSLSAKKARPSPSSHTGPVKTRVVSATERMNLHVAMTLELKDAAPGTSVECKMPGCKSMLSYDQLSNHFLGHETSANGDTNSQSSLPCVACGLVFKEKRDLDNHTKTKHGSGAIISMKERLDLLSDSSDEDDSFDRVSETTSVKETTTKKPKPKCNKCDSVFASLLHLKSHTCNANNANSESNKCDTCFKTFKTNKAVKEHMKTAHKSSPAGTKMTTVIKKENESPSNLSKRYSCQICTKRFMEFRQLRTHYTLYHVWEELAEEYKDWNDTCKICHKQYPTEDHLLQHMGNFHCKIDQYLIKRGLRIISQEKTIKLMSFVCNICKVTQTSSAALKSHMSVKHYQKELLAEFPIFRGKVKKCPKCFKLFDQSSVGTVVAHVGSFHDEVIKYAIEHLELEAADIEHVPLDDFDDGTVGAPVSMEACPFTCQKCDKKLKNKMELKLHYVLNHFQNKFGTKCPGNICKFCPDPGKPFPTSSLLYKHLVMKHDEDVWKILEEEGLSAPSSPMKPANSSRDVFEFLMCQICFQEFHSSNSLKIHYIRHFQSNFQTQYFSRTCPHCDKEPFPDIFGSQKHVATEHADKSLIPFMEAQGLWVNKSVILPPSAAKLKRIGINVKKLDRRSIQTHLTEIEEEKSSNVNVKHACVMPGCEKSYETRDHLLTHLVINHFWKDISVEYGDSFNTDPKTCPICKEMFNINSERMAYYKHLAVNHEVVMKYVEKNKNKVKEGRSNIKLVNRMAPPAVGTSSPTTAPVLMRFSNESSDDNNEGLPSNSGVKTVVKAEAVEDKSVTRNEELVSKIRNVFSDDSDSD